MANFPPVPVINMADYPVDSDEDDISIKDSKGRTVAVVVESKMRKLSAEKMRAAIASFPVLDAHDVRDNNVDECIPILDRKRKITGMAYTRKNAIICSQNGRTFMDRLKSDKDTIPSLTKGET